MAPLPSGPSYNRFTPRRVSLQELYHTTMKAQRAVTFRLRMQGCLATIVDGVLLELILWPYPIYDMLAGTLALRASPA